MHMTLKEALRFQMQLELKFGQVQAILSFPSNVAKIETTYLRSKVIPEAADKVVVKEPVTAWYSGKNEEMVSFLLYLLDQQIILNRAIQKAKAGLELDIDLEEKLIKQRRNAASALHGMVAMFPSEKHIPDGGYGYTFNAEGNQVKYLCDAKEVTTINYDRAKMNNLRTQLCEEAEDMSSRLDTLRCTFPVVDYQPPFHADDSLETIFKQFIKTQAEAE